MDELVQSFLSKAGQRFSSEQMALLSSAVDYAQTALVDRKRASGEPAFYHDVRVAEILLDLGMDLESIMAGLLHDSIEDRASGFSRAPDFPKTVEARLLVRPRYCQRRALLSMCAKKKTSPD